MHEKKLLQDMVPVRRKISRPDPIVPLRVREQPTKKEEKYSREEASVADHPQFRHFKKPKRQPNPRRRKIWFVIIVALVCIGVILAAITYVYARASVIITAKMEQVNINGTYTATKDSTALPYEVIQTREVASTTVDASQGPLVQDKAWGLVVLYNAYSTTAQKLVIGTRLSNDRGLIYTTASTVTIPGIQKTPTVSNPNATSTGSVSVYVVGEEPGVEYNIAPTDLTGDFRVVSFQEGPKYATIYGRLRPSGNGIIGGYSGYKQVVATSTLQNASASLSQQISNKLSADLKILVPDGYVLYNGAYGINFASTTVSALSAATSALADANSNAIVSLTGSLYGIMFKKTDLAHAVASAQVAEFPPNSFVINGMESLKFTPSNPTAFQQNLKNQNGAPITFNLNGPFSIVGTFPKDALAKALTGVSVANSKAVFGQYSTIVSAHAIITPFWKRSFPDSTDKISIDIQ